MNRKKVKKAVRTFIKCCGVRYNSIVDYNDSLQFVGLTAGVDPYRLNKKLRPLGCYSDLLGDSICIFKKGE
jgi:hypothetical protein